MFPTWRPPYAPRQALVLMAGGWLVALLMVAATLLLVSAVGHPTALLLLVALLAYGFLWRRRHTR